MSGKRLSRRLFVAGLATPGSCLAFFRPGQIARAGSASAAKAVTGKGRSSATRVGIALGGGGAKGLAHILMLEALDELRVKPYRISGCSMGAVIGALYTSGLSGRDIRMLEPL